jgi:hypothetical protein
LISYYDQSSNGPSSNPPSSSSDLESTADFSSHSLIHMEIDVYRNGLNWIMKEEEDGVKQIPKNFEQDSISRILLKMKEYHFEDFKKLNELFFYWNPFSFRKKELKKELSEIFLSSINVSKL